MDYNHHEPPLTTLTTKHSLQNSGKAFRSSWRLNGLTLHSGKAFQSSWRLDSPMEAILGMSLTCRLVKDIHSGRLHQGDSPPCAGNEGEEADEKFGRQQLLARTVGLHPGGPRASAAGTTGSNR